MASKEAAEGLPRRLGRRLWGWIYLALRVELTKVGGMNKEHGA
jgi:hypothetical protein